MKVSSILEKQLEEILQSHLYCLSPEIPTRILPTQRGRYLGDFGVIET